MTVIPQEEPKQPRELLPIGDRVYTVMKAFKKKDQYDQSGVREIFIMNLKPEGSATEFRVFLRIPIYWSSPGATETQKAPRIHGQIIQDMCTIADHPKGCEFSPALLEGKKYLLSIAHKVNTPPPGEDGKPKEPVTYANIVKVLSPDTVLPKPAEEVPPPAATPPSDDVPF